MMINKRLIGTVKESKKYIAGNVICQWVSLAANITMMGAIAKMLQNLYEGADSRIGLTAMIAAVAVVVRFLCATTASRMGYLSSK
ncbi:MAG: cysteine ABC transporter ATP-binding protein, partial [Oscillospiraceae bacterium]|nr:cysteine ABC transporter ATP-binding protein [Oscillospiraceae bacterium]